MAVGSIASVVVGLVLVVAGVTKVAARDRWPADAESLGVPRSLVPLVPWCEIVLGAAMAAVVRREATGVIAAMVFAAFTVLIVVNLMRGRRPVCACFGALSARPLGWRHVARNLTLICLALISAIP